MKDDTQGNPEAVDDAVFGSESDDFFTALDNSVNSLVNEGDDNVTSNTKTEATPGNQDSNTVKGNVTDGAQNSNDSSYNNLKKRYSDSSREAQSLRAQLNKLKPFVPVLDAMKKDEGLVSHVKDYFQNGGQVSKSVKEKLNLDEDFTFDPDDMVNNADSDSRKVFTSMVDNIVQQRAGQIIQGQKQEQAQANYKNHLNGQAKSFMERNGLTKDEFTAFVNEAQHKFQNEGMTFDDMWLIVNKVKAAQNVANSTKKDMLNQMINVRNIPASQSNANNAGGKSNHTNDVFDALLNSDGSIEELLG